MLSFSPYYLKKTFRRHKQINPSLQLTVCTRYDMLIANIDVVVYIMIALSRSFSTHLKATLNSEPTWTFEGKRMSK
jgi:hypothetical protein